MFEAYCHAQIASTVTAQSVRKCIANASRWEIKCDGVERGNMQRSGCEIFYISLFFLACLIDYHASASWLRYIFCCWCVPAGNLLPLQLSVSGLTMRMSLFVYHQEKPLKMSHTLFCCSQLLRLAPGTLVCCALPAILPRAVVGKWQGRYKPNKLLLSGGGKKRKHWEKEWEYKGRKEKIKKGRTTERICIANPPPGAEMLGFTCYNLLGNWRFCVKCFLCRGKC